MFLVYIILKQWTVFFTHSDWLFKVRISSAIHSFTSSFSEQAIPNLRKLGAKSFFFFVKKVLTQSHIIFWLSQAIVTPILRDDYLTLEVGTKHLEKIAQNSA